MAGIFSKELTKAYYNGGKIEIKLVVLKNISYKYSTLNQSSGNDQSVSFNCGRNRSYSQHSRFYLKFKLDERY